MKKADESGLFGVIVINKPKNWTSFDVCGKLRGILKTKRIGHTGTLDPMAEGVLPILLGKAAKASDILPESGKSYRAGFKLGVMTDTQDSEGTVLQTDGISVVGSELRTVLDSFIGDYLQVPPMYSAVKVNGKKLYDYAREGIEIEREGKLRQVYSIRLTEYDEQAREGVIELSVSKGTYIRTLIDDAAVKLGTHGIMTSLVRTSACGFSLDDCITIEEAAALADSGEIEKAIRSLDDIFAILPEIKLDERKCTLYKNGVKLRPEQAGIKSFADGDRFRVKSPQGELISIAYIDKGKNEVRSLRNFY